MIVERNQTSIWNALRKNNAIWIWKCRAIWFWCDHCWNAVFNIGHHVVRVTLTKWRENRDEPSENDLRVSDSHGMRERKST